MIKQISQRQLSFLIATLVALLAALACNAALPGEDAPAVPGFATENPYLEVPRVTAEEAKAAHEGEEAVFVDVRGAEQYAQSHIAGAVSIPLSEIETRVDELDPNDWIITYCT